ncbi:MAG: peptidoglycan D,D-transpeptidase FtsI family protein [Acidimicrobiales bacterium]
MNNQLRRLGAGLLACYLALITMVSYIQVLHADALNTHPLNSRGVVRDFDQPRGQIVSADGVVLAQTEPSPPGDQFQYQRRYPEGDLFGHITGYLNFNFGATGVEASYNDKLSGHTVDQSVESLRALFGDSDPAGDVTLTLRKDLQQSARDLLGRQKGSIVALDPRDGSILALWSFPAFDPNPLASHDEAAAKAARDALLPNTVDTSLLAKSYQSRFFPGSTFKIVTASVGVESGRVTPDDPSFPTGSAYDPPDGNPIQNFGGEVCGGTLFTILAISCNSAFAEMGAERIGKDTMVNGAQAFGFNDKPPFDLPGAARSVFPADSVGRSKAFLGQASIGQFDTAATPLEMAMVAGAIGENGVMMTPHVMADVRDKTGNVTSTYKPQIWKNPVSAATATTMREAMVGVVQHGTGTAARISGVEVGGKTGTAQLGTTPASSHAWFVCYAGPSGVPATVAVAVIVEGEPGASETTGGTVAAPMARQLVEQILAGQADGSIPSPGG